MLSSFRWWIPLTHSAAPVSSHSQYVFFFPQFVLRQNDWNHDWRLSKIQLQTKILLNEFHDGKNFAWANQVFVIYLGMCTTCVRVWAVVTSKTESNWMDDVFLTFSLWNHCYSVSEWWLQSDGKTQMRKGSIIIMNGSIDR